MTARSLLDHQVALNEGQLRKVLVGLGDESLEYGVHPTALTLRGQLAHLCTTYLAVISVSKGEEANWDSYSGEGKSFAELEEDMFRTRDEALAAFDGMEDEPSIQHVNDYIVLHDNYHIGQLSLLHQAVDPTWSSFSLYG